MGKKIIEKGWLYEYEETAESQIINGYEVTGVRYVLGELFDTASSDWSSDVCSSDLAIKR